MLVAYLAHPQGDGLVEWGDSHASALEWVRFLMNSTQFGIVAPWILYGTAFPNSIVNEQRRVADCLSILERCDVLIVSGGVITLEMHELIRNANRWGIPVLDITMMGVTPPEHGEDGAIAITNRLGKLIRQRPRRVWMPLLTIHDLESLKSARHALYTQLPDEHSGAVRILDRVIAAAFDIGI